MSLMVWLQLNGDLENKGYHFTNITSNNITVNNNGKIGKCYSFNGSSSYIALSTPPLSNDTTEFSYCCWVNPNSTAAGCLLSNRTSTNPTGFSIFINNSGKILFDTGSRLEYTQSVFANTWTHLAFTWKKNGEKKIYINGTLMSQTTTSTPPTIANATKTLIGASQTGNAEVNGYYFNGYLNDVRIYSHCLSAAEVHEISQGLVLHYKLDDITNEIQDSSGYGHNGAIIGTPQLSSDTPRYSASMQFNGTDSTINCGRAFHVQQALAMTWSSWVYVDNWAGGIYQYFISSQQTGGIVLSVLNNNSIRARIHAYTAEDLSTSGYIQADCTAANSGITSGWHMLTGVYTTSAIKLYIDGILKKTTITTTYGAHFNNSASMYLAAESAGASSYSNLCNCKLSDVRIYYTALSDADIFSLYNTAAKVDNLHNMHTFEYIENSPEIKLTKQGQFKEGEIQEDTVTKFYKTDKIIKARQFIEK